MARVAALLLLAVALASIPDRTNAETDPAALYGTWAWTETSGGQMPGRSTPAACGCERLLLIRPGGTYEFVEQDSVHEYVLCSGRFTTRPGSGIQAAPGWAADFVLDLDGWWEPYAREFLTRLDGTDTLRMYPHGVDDALEHRFVRISRSARLTAQRIRLPLSERPARSDHERLPRPGDFVYYTDSLVAIRMVRPATPEGFPPGFSAKVLLRALVGKDGLVKDVEVIKGVEGLNDAAVAAARKWEFQPARSFGRPVAVWVEIPILFQVP